MNTRRIFLVRALGLAGAAALGAGCGSDNGTQPLPSEPSPSPSPTPSPSAVPPATGAGDFDLVPPEGTPGRTAPIVLDASGAGVLPFTARSVRGFTEPIAFTVASVTARDSQEDVIDAGGVIARLDPATLPSLPTGDTPVVLRVEGAASLPPLSRVLVDFRVEGGGLSRFLFHPTNSPAGTNSNLCRFVTRGLVLPSSLSVTLRPRTDDYPVSVFVEAAGLAGSLELRLEGLPAGLSAAPVAQPITGLPDNAGNLATIFAMLLRRTGTVARGVYPVRLVASLDGAVVRDEPVALTVEEQGEPRVPQLNLVHEGQFTVARGQSVRIPTKVTITEESGTLTFATDRLPAGVSVTFDDPSLALTAGQAVDTAFTFAATASALPGAQDLELRAEFGDYIYPIPVTLTVT